MSDRNASSALPPFGVRLAIWFLLGLFLMPGFEAFERFFLPDGLGDGEPVGLGTLAFISVWIGLLRLFGLVLDDTRRGIQLLGWSLVVSGAAFAVGMAVVQVLRMQALALLAGEHGFLIPVFTAGAVVIAGIFVTIRAHERRLRREEAEEEEGP